MSEKQILNETTEPELSTETVETTEVKPETSERTLELTELLDTELKEESSLKDIKDVNSLAKSYVNAQRMLGNAIRIPTEDAGDEDKKEFLEKLTKVPGIVKLPDGSNKDELDAFLNKIGRPTSSEDYKINLPENMGTDTKAVDAFKQTAFEAGLTNDQAAKVLGFYTQQLVAPQTEEMERTRVEGEKMLKEKWGPDYNARLNGAKLAVSKYTERHPEAMKALIDSPAGNNPALIEILSDLANGLSENEVIQGVTKSQYGMTAEDALEKIEEIRRNPDHPFHNGSDPSHGAAVKKVQKLYGIAFPGEDVS